MTNSELDRFNLGLQKGRYLLAIGLTEEEAIEHAIDGDMKKGIIAAYHPTMDSVKGLRPTSLTEYQKLTDSVKLMLSKQEHFVCSGSAYWNSLIAARAKRCGYQYTSKALLKDSAVISTDEKTIFDCLHMPFIPAKDRLEFNDSWLSSVDDDALSYFTAAVHVPQYSIDLIIQGRAKNKEDFLSIQKTIPHVDTTRNATYFLDNIQPQEVNDWGTEPDMTKVNEWILSYKNKGYQQ